MGGYLKQLFENKIQVFLQKSHKNLIKKTTNLLKLRFSEKAINLKKFENQGCLQILWPTQNT